MNKKEAAVSPVVGVMLMLVVTIIIAGVVAVFAGNMAAGTEKSPFISLDTKLVKGDNYYDTYFEMDVLSVSEPVPTADLKLTTTWYDKDNAKWVTTSTGDYSVNWFWLKSNGDKQYIEAAAPYGYGTGVAQVNSGVPNKAEQEFGKYTLIGGTVMYVYPAGQGSGYITKEAYADSGYKDGQYSTDYGDGQTYTDGMQSVFGYGWENMKTGDTVNVKLIYLPNGSTIYEKDVVVS